MLRRAFALVLIAMAVLSGPAALPQTQNSQFVLGPAQFDYDRSGSGAVLCAWAFNLEMQAATKACGLPRTPTDDAVDKAISAMDAFILANSSLHPTRAALEDFKRRASKDSIDQLRSHDFERFCRSDLAVFRSASPTQVAASVKVLLAKPREPVMNPCL